VLWLRAHVSECDGSCRRSLDPPRFCPVRPQAVRTGNPPWATAPRVESTASSVEDHVRAVGPVVDASPRQTGRARRALPPRIGSNDLGLWAYLGVNA